MTSEEREACAWLYHVFTEQTIEPYKWNDEGVEALYKMIREIKHCSVGLAFLPTIAPKSSNPAAYLKSYVFDVIKKQIKLHNSKTTVITPCKNVGVGLWAGEIQRIVMGIGS